MFAEQLSAAVAGARTYSQFNQLSATLWKAHASGLIDDNVAQTAAEALQARKTLFAPKYTTKKQMALSGLPKPFKQRSADRQQSIERRRRVATSGAVPSRLAASFTLSELAVLSVIARETKRQGSCQLPLDAVAAMAGCCRTTVQNALRQAISLGLIRVQERRRAGLKSLTNLISITCKEWRAWLRLGADRVQNSEHHVKQLFNTNTFHNQNTDRMLTSSSVPHMSNYSHSLNGRYRSGYK